jgi:hypothetical protein
LRLFEQIIGIILRVMDRKHKLTVWLGTSCRLLDFKAIGGSGMEPHIGQPNLGEAFSDLAPSLFGSLAALGRPGFANKAGQFAFMKPALTVATLIAIALGGTAHAQQGIGLRDLTPEEKTVIMDAVAPSLRNPGSAKYHWATFPAVVTAGSVNYCATVDAQSPYAAYNGRQAYIVEAQISGNRVSSAVIGLIAGGKDFAIVTNMCAKYGLDPRNAS